MRLPYVWLILGFCTAIPAVAEDVDFERHIAPLLVRMVQAITPETRATIKKDWVDLFCELLAPLCTPDLDLSPHASPGDRQAGHAAQQEPAEIQYVLSPRRS